MLTIRSILQKHIDDIDADNSNINFEQQCSIIKILSQVGSFERTSLV